MSGINLGAGQAMTALDALPFHHATEPEPTVSVATPRKCRRHEWTRDGLMETDFMGHPICARCGTIRDEDRVRRGRSSRRLGGDQERRIERVYGPTKRAEFGDAVDHIGRDFKWQSKGTRAAPPLWLTAISAPVWRSSVPGYIRTPIVHMAGLFPELEPLVIRSFVARTGTRDWLFVPSPSWSRLYPGREYASGWIVMDGAAFLDVHGRDER